MKFAPEIKLILKISLFPFFLGKNKINIKGEKSPF